jgi:hypothetical protein
MEYYRTGESDSRPRQLQDAPTPSINWGLEVPPVLLQFRYAFKWQYINTTEWHLLQRIPRVDRRHFYARHGSYLIAHFKGHPITPHWVRILIYPYLHLGLCRRPTHTDTSPLHTSRTQGPCLADALVSFISTTPCWKIIVRGNRTPDKDNCKTQL